MLDRRHLFIDGQWLTPQSGEHFEVFDPSDASLLAKVAAAGRTYVDLAVRAARRAFD